MQRRHFLSALSLASTALPLSLWAQGGLPPMQVWKDPDCGCCNDWVAYLRADGFVVQIHDTGNTAVRQRLKMPQAYASCHTALIGGYAVEGHVNAREIRRLLRERPQAIGLAVPRMPVGSPGMDGPVYGGRRDPYDVLLVQTDGSSRVYQSYFKGAGTPLAGAHPQPRATQRPNT